MIPSASPIKIRSSIRIGPEWNASCGGPTTLACSATVYKRPGLRKYALSGQAEVAEEGTQRFSLKKILFGGGNRGGTTRIGGRSGGTRVIGGKVRPIRWHESSVARCRLHVGTSHRWPDVTCAVAHASSSVITWLLVIMYLR